MPRVRAASAQLPPAPATAASMWARVKASTASRSGTGSEADQPAAPRSPAQPRAAPPIDAVPIRAR